MADLEAHSETDAADRLFRLDAGAGDPPLVFVHGHLCRHENWKAQTGHFSATNRVIACDLRGFGRSPRGEGPLTIRRLGADIAALLAELDLQGVVLIGHSMGCRAIMEALRQAPGRVAGLVLVDGSRLDGPPAGENAAATQSLDAGWGAEDYQSAARALLEAMFVEGAASGETREAIIADALSVPEETGRSLMASMLAWDSGEFDAVLAEIRVPVQILQSTRFTAAEGRRPLAPHEISPYQEQVSGRVAECDSRTISGCGHFTMIEAADAVNAAIAAFLGEHFVTGRGGGKTGKQEFDS